MGSTERVSAKILYMASVALATVIITGQTIQDSAPDCSWQRPKPPLPLSVAALASMSLGSNSGPLYSG